MKQTNRQTDKRRLTDKGALEEQTSRGASVPVEDDSTDGTTHTHRVQSFCNHNNWIVVMQCLFVWTFQLPAVATDAMMRVRWSAAVGEGDSERERERESRWTVDTVELPPKRTLPDCLLLCVCVC